ncbi:MAG: outer membrane lipoprotein chaperone LolA [Burkholderiales bacterium]|nr:outer membrane lipoprotein chaperone LolA [Burkholderiales bacterium]
MKNTVFVALLCALCAFAVPPAAAGGIDRLNQFTSGTRTMRGEFEQRIYDRSRRVTQQSKGTLAFARPGKFRWTYAKPYAQVIVGDGAKVWIYDEDLNQVTVKKLDLALGSTPAALLAGNNEALKAFDLRDEGERDGLEWVEATPKDKEGNFERIRIGFGANGPEAMELADSFGQTTVLRFTKLERNPSLDAALFRFAPPKGADVIGDQ